MHAIKDFLRTGNGAVTVALAGFGMIFLSIPSLMWVSTLIDAVRETSPVLPTHIVVLGSVAGTLDLGGLAVLIGGVMLCYKRYLAKEF